MSESTPLNDRIEAKRKAREEKTHPEVSAVSIVPPKVVTEKTTDESTYQRQGEIRNTLQELYKTVEPATEAQAEHAQRLEHVLAERGDAKRQLEWDLAQHPAQFADMLEKLFRIEKTQGDNQYFTETVAILEALGVKVTKEWGAKCQIELPDRLKTIPETPIRPERLALAENYSMVSIRTRDVWRNVNGETIRVPQKFVVVEGNQQKFRQITPNPEWTDEEQRVAEQWKQLQDLRYEYATNATHDQPFYIWKELSETEEAQLETTISEEVWETMQEEGNGISAKDFANPDFGMSKEAFDQTLQINELLSEQAVPQVYIHGWMGDNRVMADIAAQGIVETKDLLEDGKIPVAIVFDMDGVHGNLAEMIPGARLGEEKMTSREGKDQVEYALHNFFGIQADTVWGWSKGGAVIDELHAQDAQDKIEGTKYVPITPAKRDTCTFLQKQEEQSLLEQAGSLASSAVLKSADILHKVGLMKPLRKVFNVVGNVYTQLHLPGNEKTVREAADVHLMNIAEEPDVKLLQDQGLLTYDGVPNDGRHAITASIQERKTWSMGVIAKEDALVNYDSLVREIRRENLGIPYAEYGRTEGEMNGTHAVLVEKQFLSEFPLGLINASTPQELHEYQQLCEDLAVLASMQLNEDTRRMVLERGLEEIYGSRSDSVRAAFMETAKQALPHLTQHVAYFDERSRDQFQMAKLHFENRMREYGLLEEMSDNRLELPEEELVLR